MSEVPFVLTGFEPISRIGGGGFGDVWLARQSNIDRQVAIKVGHAPIDDKTVQLRFERECIALGRLSGHPNIIDVFTAGQLDDGRPYLVLEFVNGGTLWQRLQRSALAESELCRIGAQLSDALGVAHGAGVLHRDLKPENVLLRQSGDVVLGDFGIARLHDGANTTSHAITASVAYAAPEILSGKSASVASDLYGIGICLLASVLRSVPFVQKTDESIHPIINRVLSDRPPDLRAHGLSPPLSAAIHALLEKDPGNRPATAAEAKALIEHAGQQPAPPAPPHPGLGVTRPAAEVQGHASAADPNATQRPGRPFPDVPAARSTANETKIAGGPPVTGPLPQPRPTVSGAVPPSAVPQAPPAPQVPPAPPARPPGPAPTGFGSGSAPMQPMGHQGQAPPPHHPAPFHGHPGGGQATPAPYRASNGNGDRLRVFGAAFGATLLIGGLLIFVISRVTRGDEGSTSEVTTLAGSETADVEAGGDGLGSRDDVADGTDPDGTGPETVLDPGQDGTDDGDRATGLTDLTDPDGAGDGELAPLALPLTIADLGLQEPTIVQPDEEGPATPQFCDNTPVTTGLVAWEGETVSDANGFPVVFQEVVRFDTAAQATAFMTSYIATVNCTEWTIPGEGGNPDVLIRPAVVDQPAAVHGDATEEISFEAEAEFLVLVARSALVRQGTDVFLMSVTSILNSDLAELDRLLELAVERLGY